MAIIKCHECGKDISDKAPHCVHCGFPLNQTPIAATQVADKPERSVAIVYGLQQTFLIGGTIKLYIDGVYFDSVKKGDSIEIPVEKDCVLTAKCSINPLGGEKKLQAGRTVKIQIVYDRLTGKFMMNDIY